MPFSYVAAQTTSAVDVGDIEGEVAQLTEPVSPDEFSSLIVITPGKVGSVPLATRSVLSSSE